MIAIKGRHYNISMILATQTSTGISTTIRGNLDGFYLYASYGAERKRIIDNFSVGNKKEFSKIYEEKTAKPYGFLYYNNIQKRIREYTDCLI
jgi:hypothetical protein